VTTPKLQMPELVVGQAGKELTHNQALAVLDQLAQAVATGGVGATIGKVGLTGLLKGTAERVTAEALAKGATKEIAGKAGMQAAEIAARKYGAAFTMSGYTYGQELGSIYPDAVEQAKKTGNPVDLARVRVPTTTTVNLHDRHYYAPRPGKFLRPRCVAKFE